jgi:uncharacterized protein
LTEEDQQFVPVNSQVLQKKEGYRQLFSLYSLLQLATRCDFLQIDFKNLVEIKDVPTLYEYWCFFQIKSIIDTFSTPTAIDRLIVENPVEHKLTTGLCITYQDGITLFFNKAYAGSPGVDNPDAAAMTSYQTGPSYSQPFVPDIVVEKAGKKIIFDAKYKGRKGGSGFYGGDDQGSVWTWKPEDINKMHTYREAITGVAGSFVLFPGFTSIIYPKNGPDTGRVFEGVGACCLRPKAADSTGKTDQKKSVHCCLNFLCQPEAERCPNITKTGDIRTVTLYDILLLICLCQLFCQFIGHLCNDL